VPLIQILTTQIPITLVDRNSSHEVWFDLDRLKPGVDWAHYIEEGLAWISKDGNGRVVLIMTPYSVRRPDVFCLNELARAILKNLKIIPIMLVWCEPPLNKSFLCLVRWFKIVTFLGPKVRNVGSTIKSFNFLLNIEPSHFSFRESKGGVLVSQPSKSHCDFSDKNYKE
jgi:hypothetical protein